jgi:UDP-N-acetylglucosamine 1-carboxyvinyltransferase
MGADIKGAGTAVVTINGVRELSPVETEIIPDRIEAGTFMAAAALTGGDVTLTHCQPDHLGAVCDKFQQAGMDLSIQGASIRVAADHPVRSVDVQTQTYPGFPTDMQAQFMVLMTCAEGQSIIKETIFENRFIHVSELRRLGADITVSGDTAIVRGVKGLFGAPVMASDLRASASLVVAGLVAEGQTEVNRVYHIDRGYERIEEKLRQLGASIWRERI